MNRIVLLLISALICQTVFSQFKNPSEEYSAAFIEREKLYVEDFFENDEQREWFKKYWKFDQEIYFVDWDRMRIIVTQENSNVGILSTGKRVERDQMNDYSREFSTYMLAAYLGEKAKNWNSKYVDDYKKKEIFKLSLTHKPLTEQDFKFIGQVFYNYLTTATGGKKGAGKVRLEDENIASLSTKTLLIPSSICSLTESEIAENYPYPFKLTDEEYIGNAILNENPDEVYIKLIFSDVGFNWAVFCIDTENGMIRNKIGTGGVSFAFYVPSGLGSMEAKHKLMPFELKPIHLKAMTKRIQRTFE